MSIFAQSMSCKYCGHIICICDHGTAIPPPPSVTITVTNNSEPPTGEYNGRGGMAHYPTQTKEEREAEARKEKEARKMRPVKNYRDKRPKKEWE